MTSSVLVKAMAWPVKVSQLTSNGEAHSSVRVAPAQTREFFFWSDGDLRIHEVQKGEPEFSEAPAPLVDAEAILQFFAYSHLPLKLRSVSAPFGELAARLVSTLPRNPERKAALRKLLEAKDAAVRAALFV